MKPQLKTFLVAWVFFAVFFWLVFSVGSKELLIPPFELSLPAFGSAVGIAVSIGGPSALLAWVVSLAKRGQP